MSSEGMLGAPVDELGEELAGVHAVGCQLHRFAGLGAHLVVRQVAGGFLVLLGNPEQHADHPHRHLGAEVADEVETVGADDGIQTVRAEFADLGLQRGDLARREHAGQQLAVHVVERRVLEDDHAGRDVDVGLDQLDDGATGRTERLVVDDRVVDIGEPAERIEVVLLVVVQRRLFTDCPERLIGVGIDLHVVRVVIDAVRCSHCHRVSPLAARAWSIALRICGNSVIRRLRVSTWNPFSLLSILPDRESPSRNGFLGAICEHFCVMRPTNSLSSRNRSSASCA